MAPLFNSLLAIVVLVCFEIYFPGKLEALIRIVLVALVTIYEGGWYWYEVHVRGEPDYKKDFHNTQQQSMQQALKQNNTRSVEQTSIPTKLVSVCDVRFAWRCRDLNC